MPPWLFEARLTELCCSALRQRRRRRTRFTPRIQHAAQHVISTGVVSVGSVVNHAAHHSLAMTPSARTWWPLRAPARSIVFSTPLDANHDLTHSLGILLDRWSHIEAELYTTFCHLLDGNKTAARAILYSLNSTKTKLAMIETVVQAVVPSGPEKEGLIYLLDKIRGLNNERNEYVHGEYWVQGSGSALRNVRPQSSTPITYRTVSPKTILAHVSQVEHRMMQLVLLNEEEPERGKAHPLARAWPGISR